MRITADLLRAIGLAKIDVATFVDVFGEEPTKITSEKVFFLLKESPGYWERVVGRLTPVEATKALGEYLQALQMLQEHAQQELHRAFMHDRRQGENILDKSRKAILAAQANYHQKIAGIVEDIQRSKENV
jgi:hypothetical protein